MRQKETEYEEVIKRQFIEVSADGLGSGLIGGIMLIGISALIHFADVDEDEITDALDKQEDTASWVFYIMKYSYIVGVPLIIHDLFFI